jgi:dienelactone hydrolase
VGRLTRPFAQAFAAALLLGAAAIAAAADVVAIPSQDGTLALSAHWYPAPKAGPRPAVIALHGCNGMRAQNGAINGTWRRYAGYFNAEGMHLLALDSFSARGLRSICETPNARRTVTEEDRRADVFAALQWLAQQPGVDPSRLIVAGWSHGAQAVLSTVDASDPAVKAQPVQPRAAIAFYPGCTKFNRAPNYALAVPLLVLSGAADDWTPAAPCVALQQRLAGKPGAPMDLEVYPDSHHGFDGSAPLRVREAANTRSGQATVGGNPEAMAKSHARMFEFLAAQLGMKLSLAHEQRLQVRPAAAVPMPALPAAPAATSAPAR